MLIKLCPIYWTPGLKAPWKVSNIMDARTQEDICPLSSNLVWNEGECLSPYSQCQSLAPFMGNSSSHWCQKQHSIMFTDSLYRCFIVAELFLMDLSMVILKMWGSTSRAQRPLMTGIVRRQLRSLTHWGLVTPFGSIDLGQHWLR